MIPLFPERMLDGSIHTSVLVGIVTLWLLNETLGFVFAGFVVAGYLAALAMAAPMSLVAIVLEAVLTYGLVHALGRWLPDRDLYGHSFGRERFLLYILVSIPVRLIVEGLGAPTFELWLQPLFEDPLWRGAHFFGIGVVLVPLLANAFWKLGLSRGAVQVGTSTLVTWVVLRWVVEPLTNFHLGAFELTFEDVAVHFLAVPKIYIVLLLTAAVAARNNVRYGWDFGGILVPALLAIVAFTPLKLLSTFVEVIVLVGAYKTLVSLPWIRELDLEGPRRLVSMYALSWMLKWVLALAAEHLAPWLYVSDLYGFGYLLTSLVAVRCVQKGHTARTLVALGVTTGQGLVLALVVSLGLSLLLPGGGGQPRGPLRVQERPLERAVLLAHASVRTETDRTGAAQAELSSLLLQLQRLSSSDPDLDKVATTWLDRGGHVEWAVRGDGQRCLGLRAVRTSARTTSGIPSVWWCGGSGPGLVVPHPLDDPDSLWMAAWLAHRSPVSYVVVAGLDPGPAAPLEGASARPSARHFERIRGALGQRTALVVHSTTSAESSLDPRSPPATRAAASLEPIASVPVRFSAEHGPLWTRLGDQDAELTLSVTQVARSQAGAVSQPLDALLGPLPPATSTPLRPEERLVAAEVLLGSALRWTEPGATMGPLPWLAGVLGVEVHAATDAQGRPCQVLRQGPEGPPGWGTWVLRQGQGSWVVATPFSQDERGSSHVARALFERLGARALWISGHGQLPGDGSALTLGLERLPLEPLALRQALRPGLDGILTRRLLMVRSQPSAQATPWQERPEGLVLSTGAELQDRASRQLLLTELEEALWPWPGAGFEDGRAVTASMATFGQFPVKYMNALEDGRAVVAWFSPDVLTEVEGVAEHASRAEWYRSQGVEVVQTSEASALLGTVHADQPVPGPPELVVPLRHHVETLDRASLGQLGRASQDQVLVLVSGLRYTVLAWDEAHLCAAVAGAGDQAVRFPLNGCWAREEAP